MFLRQKPSIDQSLRNTGGLIFPYFLTNSNLLRKYIFFKIVKNITSILQIGNFTSLTYHLQCHKDRRATETTNQIIQSLFTELPTTWSRDWWFSNLDVHENNLLDLSRHKLLDFKPRVSNSVSAGWGLRTCISYMLPEDDDDTGTGTPFGELQFYTQRSMNLGTLASSKFQFSQRKKTINKKQRIIMLDYADKNTSAVKGSKKR